MPSFDDFQLERTNRPDRLELVQPASRLPWILAIVAVLLAGGGFLWFRYADRPVPAQTAASARPVIPDAPRTPLGGTAEAAEVPPLGESDPMVRTLVKSLSAHPSVLSWLATDGLIRNFTVVVDNIAEGTTPARHLPVLKPSGRFATTGLGSTLRIDPSSYRRYDTLAAAVDSVDPQAAARVYATLKPRIEEAHRELGETAPFDGALESAIVQLVRTSPAVDDRIVPKGAVAYQFADTRVESLNGAQKLLLRMGPRNARIVQDKLRAIGLALGIPAGRLGS